MFFLRLLKRFIVFCFAKGHKTWTFLVSFIGVFSGVIQICQTNPETGFFHNFCSASSQIVQPFGVKLYDDKKYPQDIKPPETINPLKAVIPAPIIVEPKIGEKIDWAKLGLNAQTKEKLPIAVVKQGSDNVDYRTRSKLSEVLQGHGFNIVDESEAALQIVISPLEMKAEMAGKPFQGSAYAQWNGIATFNLKVVWTKAHNLLFEQQFQGRSAASNDSTAKETARKDALKQAEEKILTLVQ